MGILYREREKKENTLEKKAKQKAEKNGSFFALLLGPINDVFWLVLRTKRRA